VTGVPAEHHSFARSVNTPDLGRPPTAAIFEAALGQISRFGWSSISGRPRPCDKITLYIEVGPTRQRASGFWVFGGTERFACTGPEARLAERMDGA
jgi:hypothetical protein